MKTFEEMMELTRTISSSAALSDNEAKLLYLLAMRIPARGHIVEIGCQYGRSSSLLAQVAKQNDLLLTCIDPFTQPPEAAKPWANMMFDIGCEFTLHRMPSRNVPLPPEIDLLFIDGDHTLEGVATDCVYYLHRVAPGGYALFHDYGHDSLPGVYEAVSTYVVEPEWKLLDVVDTLGAWRHNVAD